MIARDSVGQSPPDACRASCRLGSWADGDWGSFCLAHEADLPNQCEGKKSRGSSNHWRPRACKSTSHKKGAPGIRR